MSKRNIAAFGLYTDQASAAEAMDSFLRIGFRNEDIAILRPHNAGSKDFGHVKRTKAPATAAAGATMGAVIGGVLGWLVGTGAFGAVPWLAPFLAANPAGTVLAGMGAGSVLGLLIGALTGLAMPVYEAKRYDGRIRNGGILLSAHCDNGDWVKRAKDILRETGANGIATRPEARADFASGRKPLPRARTTGFVEHEFVEPVEITAREENLQSVRRFSSDE